VNGGSQFDATNEANTGIIAAAGTIVTVIKDPLFSILEEDLNKTHPAG
jgi:hypothetical protein